MTHRIYLPSSGVAAITIPYDPSWGDTTQADSLEAKVGTTSGSGFVTKTVTSSAIHSVLARQYISQPLPDTLVVPAFTGGVVRAEWNTHPPYAILKIFKIVDATGATVRDVWGNVSVPTVGTGYPMQVYSADVAPYGHFPWAPATSYYHGSFAYVSLSDEFVRLYPNLYQPSGHSSDQVLTVQAGDRLVIEIGWSIKLSSTVSVDLEFGDSGSTDINLATPFPAGPFPQNNPFVDLCFPTVSSGGSGSAKKTSRYRKPFSPTHTPSTQQYPAVSPSGNKFNDFMGGTIVGN